MYVCLCHAVTDSHINEAVQGGATKLKHITKNLKVTTTCGRCRRCATECLKEACARNAEGSNDLAAQTALDCAV